jgi:proteasome lid subunit RPN8/RPN11
MSLISKLEKLYKDDVERVGFILPRGKIIECTNISETPEKGFNVSDQDILKYGDDAVATWHTHPKADNNLSAMDMETFLVWSNLDHYIVGTNGVRKYVIQDGEVLID